MATFDSKHHQYEDTDPNVFDSPCKVCGRAYEDEVHMSFEEFSREMDQVFG